MAGETIEIGGGGLSDHKLGGQFHQADTLSNLNSKVSDGTLVDKDTANTWSKQQTLQAALNLISGQIVFPSTQQASGDGNTLDDYEEGTWTPVISFSTEGDLTVVYSTQEGTYTKQGRTVTCTFSIVTSTFTHSTASGNARLEGFPFTSQNISGLHYFGTLNWQGVNKTNYTQICILILANNIVGSLQAMGMGQNQSAAGVGDMPSGGDLILRGGLTYEV